MSVRELRARVFIDPLLGWFTGARESFGKGRGERAVEGCAANGVSFGQDVEKLMKTTLRTRSVFIVSTVFGTAWSMNLSNFCNTPGKMWPTGSDSWQFNTQHVKLILTVRNLDTIWQTAFDCWQ